MKRLTAKKNPTTKRKRLTAKEKTSRQKEKDSRLKKKPHDKKKKTHGKRKNLPVPTLSFLPWGHCYFFCREVILFCRARSLFLLAVRFFLSKWAIFFCRDSWQWTINASENTDVSNKKWLLTYRRQGSLSCSARSFSHIPAMTKSSADKLHRLNSFSQFRRTTRNWSHSCISRLTGITPTHAFINFFQ